ncbi:MAG TPA: ammonium transporter, partial [Bacillota bacterium]|nr:ammonium transporter [Bacillota bacterium]
MRLRMWRNVFVFLLAIGFPKITFAAEAVDQVAKSVDLLWVLVAAILVFFMQAGFALLEAGSTRMKNAGHVAGKTVLTFGLCTLIFWAVGFGVTFGEGNSFFGLKGFLLQGVDEVAGIPTPFFFLFQLAFAAVSLAIAFGGFAERAKLSVYLVFSILFTAFIYPVVGHWVWGGGWLSEWGMQDFAGSTVVHLQGGIAALIATLLLKPRLGKYNKNGTPNLIPGHNQVYTVLGVLILWVGWFGFNAGSTLGVSNGLFGHVALTTQLATAAGVVFALLTSWMYSGKADIAAMLNGALAALVAITAACAFVEPWAAVIIGAVAGMATYGTSVYFDRKGIDDPICAFSVHGIAGVIGTISTGFFASPRLVEITGVGKAGLFYGGGLEQLWVQVVGVLGAALYVAIISFVILFALKKTIGIRVTEEEEIVGLDL